MRILTEADFRSEAKPVLRQVFVNDDAFGQPFSPNIVARTITYPHSEYIEPPLIDAIISAATNLLGDIGCYIYDLWGEDEQHYYLPFAEFSMVYSGVVNSAEFSLCLSLENILYSPTGKWGIMISHGRHGMLGGSVEFIEDIRQTVPDLDRQVYNFIEERLRRRETGKIPEVVLRWLPDLLLHVYGQATAEKIMREIGLT